MTNSQQWQWVDSPSQIGGSTNAESREGEGPQAQAEHGVVADWVITRLNVNQGEKSKEWLSGWEKLQLTVQIEIEGLLWVNHDVWNTNQRWTDLG